MLRLHSCESNREPHEQRLKQKEVYLRKQEVPGLAVQGTCGSSVVPGRMEVSIFLPTAILSLWTSVIMFTPRGCIMAAGLPASPLFSRQEEGRMNDTEVTAKGLPYQEFVFWR